MENITDHLKKHTQKNLNVLQMHSRCIIASNQIKNFKEKSTSRSNFQKMAEASSVSFLMRIHNLDDKREKIVKSRQVIISEDAT